MSTLQSNPQTSTGSTAVKPKYKGKSGAQIFHQFLRCDLSSMQCLHGQKLVENFRGRVLGLS